MQLVQFKSCRDREEKGLNLFESMVKLGMAGVVLGMVAATLG